MRDCFSFNRDGKTWQQRTFNTFHMAFHKNLGRVRMNFFKQQR